MFEASALICKAELSCSYVFTHIYIVHVYISIYMVGGLEHVLCFHILGMIIPIDSYFSEG